MSSRSKRKLKLEESNDEKAKVAKFQEKNNKSISDLPDEILLKIFVNLSSKELIHCSLVSRRFRSISYDESLWQKSVTDLPDDILLKIFVNLSFKDLINCSHVSRRFRSVSHDESLWQNVNSSTSPSTAENVQASRIRSAFYRCTFKNIDFLIRVFLSGATMENCKFDPKMISQ